MISRCRKPRPATHVPIPHQRVVDLIAHSLAYFGHHVTERHFGITPDGMRFFEVMCLKSDYTGYKDRPMLMPDRWRAIIPPGLVPLSAAAAVGHERGVNG